MINEIIMERDVLRSRVAELESRLDSLVEFAREVIEQYVENGSIVLTERLDKLVGVVERLNPFVQEPPRGEIVNPHVQPDVPEPDRYAGLLQKYKDGGGA